MSIRDAILAESPLQYLRLEEGGGASVADASGNGRHGTLEGSYQWITTKFGRAVDFSGAATGRISTTYRPWDAGTRRTFLIFARRFATGGTDVLAGSDDATNYFQWWLSSADSMIFRPDVMVTGATGSKTWAGAGAPTTYPVLYGLTWDPAGDTVEAWKNSTSQGVQAGFTQDVHATIGNLKWGARSAGAAGSFGGSIEHCAVLPASFVPSTASMRRLMYGISRTERADAAAATFTPVGGLPASIDGSLAFGADARFLDLGAVIAHGGITTQDAEIQEALRSSALFTVS